MFVSKRTNILINILLFALLLSQIMIWNFTERHTPSLEILSEPPGLEYANLLALGDEQFYFRYLALQMQNAGDSFGRFTALREYDYAQLLKWMKLLDAFDSKSHFVPAIASYYYSNTQYIPDNRYLIDYLESTYEKDPMNRWWWLVQAAHIANHKLKDKLLALRLSYRLANSPAQNMPKWARQMPAFISAEMGEEEQALAIIKDLAESHDDYTQSEINFMNYFIKERLGFLEEKINKKPAIKDVKPLY